MSGAERRDPTLDDVHREMVAHNESAVSEVPELVRRLSLAAEGAQKESRLVRLETKKARNASHPGMPRPKIPAKK